MSTTITSGVFHTIQSSCLPLGQDQCMVSVPIFNQGRFMVWGFQLYNKAFLITFKEGGSL